MNLKKYGNLYAGLMFLAFTIVFAVQIPNIRRTPIGIIDSRAYPILIVTLLLVLSSILMIMSIRDLMRGKINEGGEQEADEGGKKNYVCVLITLALSIVYVMLLQPLGFLISSAIYMFFLTINLCPAEKLRPVLFAVIAIVSSTVIYSVFRYGLNLMLPGGILTGIF